MLTEASESVILEAGVYQRQPENMAFGPKAVDNADLHPRPAFRTVPQAQLQSM